MANPSAAAVWKHHACFAGLCLLAAVIAHRALLLVASSSLTADAFAPFAVIPPVSLALLCNERKILFSSCVYWSGGLIAYVALFAVLAWSTRSANDTLTILLFSAACLAAFGMSYGRLAGSKALFPLSILLAIAPLPNPWLDATVRFLQQGSALATGWLFSLAGVPFTREGLVFSLPKLDIEIARECSGIRSSLLLLICAFVLGHLFLRSAWTKTTLALAVIPFTIVKNGLRIFTLSLLGMYVDDSFLTGRLHRNGGVLFFALAFAALFGTVKLLHRLEPSRPSSDTTPRPTIAVESAL